MTEGLLEKMFKTFGEPYLDPFGDLRESSDTPHSGIVDGDDSGRGPKAPTMCPSSLCRALPPDYSWSNYFFVSVARSLAVTLLLPSLAEASARS